MSTPFGTLFNKGASPVLERALSFHEQRHKLIAHNIANVETPYFKPVDLPEGTFQDALNRSIKARDSREVRTFSLRPRGGIYETGPQISDNPGLRKNMPHGRSGLSEDQRSGLHFKIGRSEQQGTMRHSENRVDIDKEMAKLASNGMKYRVYAGMLKKHYALLRYTISERA